jgi:hypothetical protein
VASETELKLEEASLAAMADEYSYLDGEQGYVVRNGTQVGWEKDGILIYTYELDTVPAAQGKFEAVVKEHALAVQV